MSRRAIYGRLGLSAVLLATLTLGGVAQAGAEEPDPRPQRPPVSAPEPPRPVPEPAPLSRADLPAGFDSWEALFDEQHRLNAIADRIVAAGRSGLGNLVVDPENHDVRLYWKGALPVAVRAAVEDGRQQAPVRVFSAAYTETELETEAQRWIDSGLATDAYGQPDGGGVVVEVAGPPSAGSPALPGGSRTPFTVKHDQDKFVPLTGGSDATTSSPFPVSRWFDISPFWGGSRFQGPGGACTTGFAVRDAEGYASFLTAGHCGEPGNEVTTMWAPDKIGQLWWDWDSQDIALIWVYSDSHGFIYTGPWNSSSGRIVAGAQSNYEGNYVCTDGSRSGEHCSVKVYDVSPSDVTIRAQRTKNGACAAAHGDSGGPVIAETSGAAWGKGIISAGSDSVSTCEPDSGPGYHKVKYKGLKFTLGYFGATLRKGLN